MNSKSVLNWKVNKYDLIYKWGEGMNAQMYQTKIREAEHGLGIYRVEFAQTRVRLADIYVRIELLQKTFENGEFQFTTIVQTKNGEMEVVDPHIVELDRLNDQALAYEKALGLTAESVRKMNPEIFAPEEKGPSSPLAFALRKLDTA